jgi:hypothetical protein
MATEVHYLQGKAKWAKLTNPDDYGKWKIVLYPNPASLVKIEEFKKRGLKNELKKDDDGYYMNFARPTFKNFPGKPATPLAPPEVMYKDGTKCVELIGNGSDVIIKVEVYGFKRFPGIAAQLAAVKITELVPFVATVEGTPEQQALASGFEKPQSHIEEF